MAEIISPVISQPTGSNPVGLSKWPFVALFSFLLGIASVLAYQKYLPASQPTRSVLVAPSPLVLPVSSPTALPAEVLTPVGDWQIYTNKEYNFSFKYPTNYLLESDLELNRNYINKNIEFRVDKASLSNCRGDCPLVEKNAETSINGTIVNRLEGYIGEIGGNIPQRFVIYEIKSGDNYIIFNLQATPFKISKEEFSKYYVLGKIIEITENDKQIFDLILSTFKFID